MTTTYRTFSLLLAVTLAALLPLLPGCTSSRTAEKEITLSPTAVRSIDGALSYRVPQGWFDASADSASRGFSVWLLRPDFRASIAVSEVHLDASARATVLGDGGVVELARLTMALSVGNRTGVVEQQPEELRINGVPACRYEVRTAPDKLLRTVLLQIRERFYAVTAFLPAHEREDVVAVQQAFLDTLNW